MRRTTVHARARRATAALALLALLATLSTGCSKKDDDRAQDAAEASGDAPGDQTTMTTTIVVDPQADQAAAEAVVLSATDVPDMVLGLDNGAARAGRPERLDEVGACLQTPLVEDGYAIAHAAGYTNLSDGNVAASVVVAPSVAEAKHVMEVVRMADTPRCYAEAVTGEVAEMSAAGPNPLYPDAELGEPTGESREFEPLGDDTAAVRVTWPVVLYPDMDGTMDTFLDIVYLRVGRAVIVTSFTSPIEELDPVFSGRVIERMIDRVPPEAADG